MIFRKRENPLSTTNINTHVQKHFTMSTETKTQQTAQTASDEKKEKKELSLSDFLIKGYEYQEPHARKMIEILKENRFAFDITATGDGKTYITFLIAYLLGLKKASEKKSDK